MQFGHLVSLSLKRTLRPNLLTHCLKRCLLDCLNRLLYIDEEHYPGHLVTCDVDLEFRSLLEVTAECAYEQLTIY